MPTAKPRKSKVPVKKSKPVKKAKTKTSFAAAILKGDKSKKRSRAIPFRLLERDGVTYSFLDEFLKCREQARLSYVEGYAQKQLIEAFEFGNCIHGCLEAQGKSKGRAFDHNKILNDFRAMRNKVLRGGEKTELNRIVETARLVWPAYVAYWRQKQGMELLPDCEFVSNEEDFKLSHTLPNGTDIILRGRLDGVLRYKGKLWLMENKTKSVVDERIADYLPHDMQTQMYCHAVNLKYGEKVEGILYNVVRRPGLRIGKGTIPNLLTRIGADLAERPKFYFLRWNIYLDPTDTEKWVERVLNPILTQVQMWWNEIKENPFDPFSIPNRVHHWMSPTGLYSQYGRSNYFDLLTNGNDFGFYRRDRK